MREFWAHAAAMVWGPVTVTLLMGTGIYLSLRLRFSHLRRFALGWRFAAQRAQLPADAQETGSAPSGDISPWQSMMTMLAGAGVRDAARLGAARGRYANEAGVGTA